MDCRPDWNHTSRPHPLAAEALAGAADNTLTLLTNAGLQTSRGKRSVPKWSLPYRRLCAHRGTEKRLRQTSPQAKS